MLRTNEGKLVSEVIRKFREGETAYVLGDRYFTFYVDGKTSGYINNDDKTVKVEMDAVYVILSCGKNEMKLPNFGDVYNFISNVERGIEIMFWMSDVEV